MPKHARDLVQPLNTKIFDHSPNFLDTPRIYIQGAPKKNDPLAKRRYFDNRYVFLHNFYSAYRGDIFTCLHQILLQGIDAFKSYELSTKNVKISN